MLPGYRIGRYPVTVARFRAFVEASGYQVGDARSLEGPDEHPVVWVTWHDATKLVTFCRALNAVTFTVAERRMSIASWPA